MKKRDERDDSKYPAATGRCITYIPIDSEKIYFNNIPTFSANVKENPGLRPRRALA
jgi:hypothetical protein